MERGRWVCLFVVGIGSNFGMMFKLYLLVVCECV
jgi:hypothetical protein